MQSFLLPAAVFIAAWFAAPLSGDIPLSFAGLWAYGPYLSLGALMLLALAWQRGRAVLAAILFGVTVLMFDDLLPAEDRPPLFASLMAFLVLPLNILIVAMYRERGIFNVFGVIRAGVVGVQCLALYAASLHLDESINAMLAWGSDIASLPVPLPLLVVTAVCALLLGAVALLQQSRFSAALCVSVIGLAVAVGGPEREGTLFAAVIAAGLVIIIAMLQDSWRLAYRDDLTGLPSRRALNETFLSLGGQYSVAMLDVDHFKKFNDTHGHDVGDDVLKMVAAQIARVSGGGRAFRYGGEEFTIVFPSRSKAEAMIALEGVRESVEHYRMVVRDKRSRDGKTGADQRGRGAGTGQKTVSVTISIGVAEHERGEESADTLKRADEALYMAKKAGRNCVRAYGFRPQAKRASRAA